METRERVSGRRGRLGALFLATALVCALLTGFAQAAPAEGGSAILESAAPKPQITIQGNVVVDKGKPTGFYELALCVQTARTVTVKDTDTVVDDSIYADALAAAAEGDEDALKDFFNQYDVKNYPFQSAAAAMYINLDALTAVTWGAGKPIYDDWSATGGTSGNYTTDAARDTHYPRGINKNSEEVKDQPQIFTDLDPVLNSNGVQKARVRLDSAKPDEVNNATAFIEKAEFSETDATKRTALLTLSANTTTTANVVYATPTPVVVVRFAYDMNRFAKLEVGNPRDLTNEPNKSDFWLGLDKNDNDLSDKDLPIHSGKTPLTYLGARDASGNMYATSDGEVARSSVFQSVLYAQNLASDGVTQQTTRFYYYLGAEAPSYQNDTVTISVLDEATGNDSEETLHLPVTEGSAILAPRDDRYATPGDPDAPGATDANGKYSFFQNLLRKADDTLRLDLVNAETYRKPTGGVGGAQILFYDWDDSLIGALVVDPEGDARAAVNEYIEKTLIHPELRTGDNIAAAPDLATLQTDKDYVDRVESLDRKYTYRGDYAYEVGQDTDDTLKRPATHAQPGEDYPLTNKLDYAFYRRATTQTEAVDPGTGLLTRYYSTTPLSTGDGSEDYDDYLYPYVHGWAIVEDETQDLSKKNWILRKDSIKTEDVWTTFGVGELADLDPANATTQTIPGTTTNYTYAVTEKDAAWYLRFADFSAMEKMLRSDGDNHQDVLIVKAVYEPGTSLLPLTHYTVVEDSLNVERYSYAASTGLSVYSFQYQYQRASDQATGVWQGVLRVREPAVQTGYTYDVNAFDSEFKDLDPTVDTKTFFMKTVSNNNDIMDIDVTASGVLWKIDYKLVDIYGRNVATGVDRSNGGELNLKNNFKYDDEIGYDERQGTDGYIQEATLNTLLKEATKAARNEEDDLLRHFTVDTVTDLNLRADADGTRFNAGDYDLCAIYLQDLVTRLYNDGVSIDPKTGDVTLGWHQIQRHILMCMQANSAVAGIYSGGTLMSETDCAGFPWCRLDDCAAEVKVDIFDLGDIFVAMDKAKDEGDKHPAKDALDDLKNGTPPLLDGYLNKFRKDPDGRPFKTRQEVYDALKTVYDKLAAAGWSQDDMKQVTEEQVQHIIATGSIPTTAPTIYWWWDGGTRPVATWQDWIDAGMLVVTGDVPDALDGMTNANLPNAVQDMISYERPTTANTPPNVGWFRKAESDEDNNAFTDVEEFKTAWIQALTVLKDHYDLPKEWNTIPWQEIQWALIKGSYKPANEVLAETNYWWKDGGLPKLTYEKLLVGINNYCVDGDATELDRLLTKGINPVNNEVYLRCTPVGGGFTDLAQFKLVLKDVTTLLPYATNGNDFLDINGKITNMTIYQMQYVLLNYGTMVGTTIPTDAEIRANYDYWWIEDPHLPTSAQPIGDIMDLMNYTYWAKDGVDGVMLGFDPLEKLDAAVMTSLGLRAEGHGVPYSAEDVRAAVIAAVSKMPYRIDNFSAQTAADLTKELQYTLLHGSHQTAGQIPKTENYWWQGDAGFPVTDQTTLLQADWMYHVGFGGGTVPDGRDKMTDLDFITRRTDENNDGLAMRTNLDGAPFANMTLFQSALDAAVDKMVAAGLTYDDMEKITQYQLQYLLLGGEYKSDADVKAEVIVGDVDAYWWFNYDEKPGGGETKTEITVDADEWSAFLTSAAAYFKNKNGDAAAFVYPLTDEKVEKVLRLHQGDGNAVTAGELFVGDKSDLTWRVLDAIFRSSRKKEFFNTLKRTMIKQPTWYEFQYVLLHLSDVVDTKTMPDSATCEAEKEKWDWIWEVSGGPVEYEQVQPDATEWNDFMTSAAGYFKNKNGDAAAFVYPLTDEKIASTLYLAQSDSSAITTADLFAGDKSDLLWRTLDAIFKSSRKKEFFNTLKRTMIKQPTWYEFQYVLAHLSEVVDTKTMPDSATCEAWATQENAPWVWKEKAAGASLLAIEEDSPVPLAPLPGDVLPTDIVENGPMGAVRASGTRSTARPSREARTSGPTMGSDDPGTSDESISVGRDDLDTPDEFVSVGRDDLDTPDEFVSVGRDDLDTPDEPISVGRDDPGAPETDETAEIPLGDEMVTVQCTSITALGHGTSRGTILCGQRMAPQTPQETPREGPIPVSPLWTFPLGQRGGLRSPSIGFSPEGLKTEPPTVQRLFVGPDALIGPNDTPKTDETSIIYVMAGPMILPLSLRRTTR